MVSVESGIAQQTITMTGTSRCRTFRSSDRKVSVSDSALASGELARPEGAQPNRSGRPRQGPVPAARSSSVCRTTPTTPSSRTTRGVQRADGGFNVKAEEAILNVNLAQACAKGRSFAIGAHRALRRPGHGHAEPAGAAVVTGRDARLYAGDLTDGGHLGRRHRQGQSLAVGILGGDQRLDRKTRARRRRRRRGRHAGSGATASTSPTASARWPASTGTCGPSRWPAPSPRPRTTSPRTRPRPRRRRAPRRASRCPARRRRRPGPPAAAAAPARLEYPKTGLAVAGGDEYKMQT